MVIKLAKFPVHVKLGVFEEERQQSQEILIDIVLKTYPALEPGLSDDLSRTMDYAEVARVIEHTVAGKEYFLVETFVELLGQSLLRTFPSAASCAVEITKIKVPNNLLRGATICVGKEFVRGNRN